MSLPVTYIPKSLRPVEPTEKRDLAFSIRLLHEDSYLHGPFANLIDALEVVPCSTGDIVIEQHNPDGTKSILYAWNHANNQWYLLDNSN